MPELRNLFVLRDIQASRVNLIMNDYAAGLPSPLSFLGLGDFLARRLKLKPWSASVLPILHAVRVSEGRTKPEMENKSSVFAPIETMEDLVGSVTVSLLINLPGCESENALARALTGCRIAGGIIQNNDVKVQALTPDGSAFRSLRRGYAMLAPEQNERRVISKGDNDSLTEIATLLFPVERPAGFGWIVPAAVGYHLLEDPEHAPKRTRTRSKDIPHVFAEPVLGIAELVSVRNRRLTELSPEAFASAFWHWDAREDMLLGHSAYFSNNKLNDVTKEVLNHG
ncbi:hypothetical protein AA106555_1821 [Neokomagataea thailandica NBRC 106555]|uniref:Type I-F CRISPR-associated protein Csy2 n=2 Tax=Neokomagataea TaxID=1223423 RepID=A0A4Y6V7R9_9PROT|nr:MULTISPECIES: type I-F CRISPR-associated protein Csy2 [Neokomagataea]QDH26082.1 hypothetical protein D5366_11775 [Neokomagataea tanensis]GBR54777.1 hypothetical protein AA106555_1821 [Neokomagataea thailandica NBRC 106555]